MKRLMLSVLVIAGCGSDSSGPNPASGANVYYLNFDGAGLTPGADDPSANQSQLVSNSVTIPAYLAGDAQRTSKIQTLIDEVEAILAPYDVAVVTTRPSSGEYDMLIAGGTSQMVGLPAGQPAVAVVDCTATPPPHISLLFDLSTGHDAARQIVGALGVSHGISATTKSSDCMCIADGSCTTLASVCTVSTTNTDVSSNVFCGTADSINVHQQFLAKFGDHP